MDWLEHYKSIRENAILHSLSNLRDKTVYGKILSSYVEDTANGYIYLQVSLRTKEMVEWDYAYFVTLKRKEKDIDDWAQINEIRHLYKPYFFEFIAPVKRKDFKKYIPKVDEKWFKVTLYDENEFDCPKNEKRNKLNTDGLVLSGNAIFSASPIITKLKYLSVDFQTKIEQQERINELEIVLNDLVKGNISNEKKGLIYQKLEKCIDSCGVVDYHIYNVGQGNFIQMDYHNNGQILFDVGFTMFNKPEKRFIRDNIKIFNELKPDIIILSHWDIDHILGLSYMENSLNNGDDIAWVAPVISNKFNEVSQSAKLLLAYLLRSERDVYLVNTIDSKTDDDRLVFNLSDSFQIWQGNGKNGRFNKNNNIGLIVKINDPAGKILFPGDCEYSHMPDACMDEYEYMVASHHGAKQDFDRIDIKSTSQDAVCICSVGKNKYGHPTVEARQWLRKQGFHIVCTDEVKECIISKDKCGGYTFECVVPE